MPKSTRPPIPPLPNGYRYATFSGRMLAGILDVCFMAIILIPLISLIEHWLGLHTGLERAKYTIAQGIVTYNDALAVLSFRLPSLLFEGCFILTSILLCWKINDTTPGKRCFGMKIVDSTTFKKPTLTQYLTRMLGYALSTLPLAIGFVAIYFDKQHSQGWHDRLSHTLVIQKKS